MSIKYIGAYDSDLRQFEGQYPVPTGISYNSYIIDDEKIAIMDSVDKRKQDEWLGNIRKILDGRKPDYIIISHLEPDHSGSLSEFLKEYPETVPVMTAKAAQMLPQFVDDEEIPKEIIKVKEKDTLSLGKHVLQFFTAPMVHWPEVMVTYEQTEKILFSADAFGRFGNPDPKFTWDNEAARYFINIVGKYGTPVQTLLKKAATLDIQKICPLHGPVLDKNLNHYIDLYNTWSSYKPEKDGVIVVSASIHGNTKTAADYITDILRKKGYDVALRDLTTDDVSGVVSDAFRYGKIILAASSYDGGVFLPMEKFLVHLKAKNFQNKQIFIIENGSWAPSAARAIKSYTDNFKNITVSDNIVTIRGKLKDADKKALDKLAEEI